MHLSSGVGTVYGLGLAFCRVAVARSAACEATPSCSGRRQLPSPARLGRARAPVPTRAGATIATMLLDEYKRKRRFEETPEPPPKVEKQSRHRFVVQRHAATRLHYD